ncbi:MAG TPA: cell division protein FtsZ [Dehalococcoidales bacterium]|nr:cell division protein FtsZ [Dehalococcoidales bacterium]
MAKSSFIQSTAKIKVIGMGGGGCNAITRMVRDEIRGVEFIAMNTDAQSLAITEAPVRFQLGERLTKGLGAGGDPNTGTRAAEENRDELAQLVSGAEMIFVTAGMGGGTGTGSIPIVAEIAKKSGALTIAIVTKPFGFEGRHRMRNAEEGIARLASKCDTLIIIPNDRLLALADKQTSIEAAFRMADECLRHGVQAISEVITVPGMINLDFADVRAIMKDAGPAWMSVGIGSGPSRAVDAAKSALASPLLDVSIKGAKGVLFNVTGSDNLTLHEVNQAAEIIRQSVDPGANIIFGVRRDEKMDRNIKITLVATGFTDANSLSNMDDEAVTKLLKSLKVEEELDIPSFMRKPLFNERRTIPGSTPSKTGTKVN